MSTGQLHLFVYSTADDAAKASLLKALDPHPLDLALHRQVQNGVVQYGRDLCRT